MWKKRNLTKSIKIKMQLVHLMELNENNRPYNKLCKKKKGMRK